VSRDWKEVLAESPECLSLERLTGALNPAEKAHVASCARCQTELALFRESTSEPRSAVEREAEAWIAGELKRRMRQESSANVRTFRSRSGRFFYALAATLVLLVGTAWWMNMREPGLDLRTEGPMRYRGGKLELVSPLDDVTEAPNELRWQSVSDASRYHVEILEVDGTVLWSGDATQTSLALPASVSSLFAPGKTLHWKVQAFRGSDKVAVSETQRVRVSVQSQRNPR
jgi:hypothetical protein